jgi:hypothetical protein
LQGACDLECRKHEDCPAGQLCTDRGRCVPPALVGQPQPVQPPSKARLEVDTRVLDFGRTGEQQALRLRNTGSEPLRYRMLSNKPWLNVTPHVGTVESQPQVLEVRIDRAQAGAEAQATLRVNSTGGAADIQVTLARDLSGLYAGEVRLTEPFAATSTVQLNLRQEEAGASLTGFVSPGASWLYPLRSALSGSIAGDTVAVTFTVAAVPGSATNPLYPRSLLRTVTLTGRVVGSGLVEGVVAEELQGAWERRSIVQRGTFRLQRSGRALEGAGDSVPTMQFTPVVSPFASAAYDTCRNNCPTPGGCATPLAAGHTWLRTSASLYRAFQEAASRGGVNPFSITRGTCSTGCVDTVALRCAQYHYAQALQAEPGSLQAQTGLLDSLEVTADYGLLFGNEYLVAGLEAWKQQGTLRQEAELLRQARAFFSAGLHGEGSAPPLALLDPWPLKLVADRVSATALSRGTSRLADLLGDTAAGRGEHEHLRRQILAVGGALRATLELADREHRLGALTEAQAVLIRGAQQAWLDLALLTPLLERSGALGLAELQPLAADFESVSRKLSDLANGRNPAGYLPGYVPFLLDTARLPATNYQQIHQYAVQTLYHGLARPEQEQALGSRREFEQEMSGLLAQAHSQHEEYSRQLHELCGATEPEQCGKPGSALSAALGEIKASEVRLRMAEQRQLNLTREIEIEQQRAARVAGIATNHAHLILANGQRMRVLDEQRLNAEGAARILDLTGQVLSALANPQGAFGIFSAAASALAGQMQAEEGTRIERKRQELFTHQSAQVEFDRAQAELVSSAALVKSKLLEGDVLALEVELATQGVLQALDTAVGVRARAVLVATQRERLLEFGTARARERMHVRLHADALSLRAQESFRLLREWTWLATRAMEYELNVSYSRQGDLWAARSADELNRYLVNMDAWYQVQRPGPVQTLVEVISVRDQLVELDTEQVDRVTGKVYAPRERFRRFVTDPAQRDMNGNLRLTFMTWRPGRPLFSQAVCNDRIKSLRINLVGDELGAGVTTAFVRLSQGGAQYLRACTGNRDLIAYDVSGPDKQPRVARVQAGVNAPQYLALPANTDLISRSVLAGPWELIIDQRPEVEPANARLDLSGLDDIELIVEHEAHTLQ